MGNAEKQKDKLYSIKEYLEMEEKSLGKHEYHNGKIVAMSGGTIPHGFIISNVNALLKNGITKNEKNCRTSASDIKVFIEKENRFVYPDSMVICDEIEISEKDKHAITNPVIIVEVLSDSTERYDRGDKFHLYCSIPSFKEYILIHQYKPVVDSLFREDSKYWKMQTIIGLDKSVFIHSLGFEIKMADIYEGISNLNNPQTYLDL